MLDVLVPSPTSCGGCFRPTGQVGQAEGVAQERCWSYMMAHWVIPQQSLMRAALVLAMVGLLGGRGGGGGGGSAFFSVGTPAKVRNGEHHWLLDSALLWEKQ
ncbi:hypothetical protein E2320_012115 [Naja naja]|nr:hypothetical protein E2320_012115 [Naja naja]